MLVIKMVITLDWFIDFIALDICFDMYVAVFVCKYQVKNELPYCYIVQLR